MTIFYTLFLSLFMFAGTAQNYRPSNEGSKVHFTIKNFGINTGGDISGVKGDIFFDPANLAASTFNVSVDVKTIDTDSEKRDLHLISDSYFDAEKFPVIAMKSSAIQANRKGYNFTGTLSIHGVTKNISFPFTATMQGSDYLFTGDFEINRLDYSVGKSSAVLSDMVKVSVSVLAKKS